MDNKKLDSDTLDILAKNIAKRVKDELNIVNYGNSQGGLLTRQ